MSITLTLNGNTSVLLADYFPPIELDQNYQYDLISLDTYNSIPSVDVENNQFHIGKHEIKIPEGSYEISDLSELLSGEYANLTQHEPVGSHKFQTTTLWNQKFFLQLPQYISIRINQSDHYWNSLRKY